MEKDPAGRYASAGEMADDLRRFLDDRPILARRPTPFELAARSARRHGTALATAGAVAALAIALGATLLWREKTRTDDARLRERKALELIVSSSDRLIMQAVSEVTRAGDGGSVDAAAFYRVTLSFYDESAVQALANPDLGEVAALALHRVGFTRMMLGDSRAEQDYRRSIGLYERLLAETPGSPDLRRALAGVLRDRGTMLRLTRGLAAGKPDYLRSLEILRELAAERPEELPPLVEYTDDLIDWAGLVDVVGRPGDAERARRRALDAFAERAARQGSSPVLRDELASACRALGKSLAAVGKPGEAEEAFRMASGLSSAR